MTNVIEDDNKSKSMRMHKLTNFTNKPSMKTIYKLKKRTNDLIVMLSNENMCLIILDQISSILGSCFQNERLKKKSTHWKKKKNDYALKWHRKLHYALKWHRKKLSTGQIFEPVIEVFPILLRAYTSRA